MATDDDLDGAGEGVESRLGAWATRGLDLEDLDPTDRQDIRDGILTTAGLTSTVFEGERGEGAAVGHVLMADYDDDADPLQLREETSQIRGVNALFESSTASWHFYNLSVRPLDDQLVSALRLHGDSEHTSVSSRRGMFVLRGWPKLHEDGTVYKPEPRLEDVWTVGLGDEETPPQSRPHWEFIEDTARRQGYDLDADLSGVEWVGDRTTISEYMTVTDELKREVWG